MAKSRNWGESESGEKYEAGGGEPPPRQFGSWALSLCQSGYPDLQKHPFFCFDLNVGNVVVFAWAGVKIICRDRKAQYMW